jgi:predicted DNA-binding transcriptional regulator AlpA
VSHGLDPLLTREDVASYLGVHSNTLDLMRQRDPGFPPPVTLPGSRLLRWRASELAAWIDGRQDPGATPIRRRRGRSAADLLGG